MKPMTLDDVANLYDKRHDGKKARTLPIYEVLTWLETQHDVRCDEETGLFYYEGE